MNQAITLSTCAFGSDEQNSSYYARQFERAMKAGFDGFELTWYSDNAIPQILEAVHLSGAPIIAIHGVGKGNWFADTPEEQKKAAQDAIIVGSADVFAGYKAKVNHDRKLRWEESGLLQMREFGQGLLQKIDNGEFDYSEYNNNNNLISHKDKWRKATKLASMLDSAYEKGYLKGLEW